MFDAGKLITEAMQEQKAMDAMHLYSRRQSKVLVDMLMQGPRLRITPGQRDFILRRGVHIPTAEGRAAPVESQRAASDLLRRNRGR